MLPLIKDRSEEQLKEDILNFSRDHGVNISPEKDLDAYVRRLKSTNHCACNDNRFSCPCEQALGEVQKYGYCLCRLFMNDEYLEYIKSRGLRTPR